jgi:hypothetical protein
VTFNIIDEEYERLAQVADVLGYSVEEFLFREGIDFIVSGLESSVADNLVCRIWDTMEEAQTAAGKLMRSTRRLTSGTTTVGLMVGFRWRWISATTTRFSRRATCSSRVAGRQTGRRPRNRNPQPTDPALCRKWPWRGFCVY